MKDNLEDMADNIDLGLRDFNMQFESVVGTTIILIGIFAISLIAIIVKNS